MERDDELRVLRRRCCLCAVSWEREALLRVSYASSGRDKVEVGLVCPKCVERLDSVRWVHGVRYDRYLYAF